MMGKLSHVTRGVFILAVILIITYFAGVEFKKAHVFDQIIPGPGVTEIKHLSDYFADLKGTYADTPIYVLEGEEPGATAFLLGGTHSREVSGVMGAVLLIENAKVTKGRLLVIPRANNSGASYTPPLGGEPGFYHIVNKNGNLREFRLGGRRTNPIHQWPDPANYYTVYGDFKIDGNESRNLNRAYPGNPDGSYTEKLAYGIMELIRNENVRISFDFHEAGTKSRLANMLIANPKGLDLAAVTILNLEMEDIQMKLEQSSKGFRGLSHREWGDNADTFSFLSETPNPGQNYRTRKFYKVLAQDTPYPLEERVGRQIATFASVVDSYNMFYDDTIVIEAIPSYGELVEKGLSGFLN